MTIGQEGERGLTSSLLQITTRMLDAFSATGNFRLTVIALFAILFLQMVPLDLGPNEINYFELARRFIDPDAFSEHSAVFDNSAARAMSFGLIGGLVKFFGMKAAVATIRLAMIAAFAVTIAALARAWALSAAEIIMALALFLTVGQNYFAGEWIFGGVEAKVFAYVAVIAAIAALSKGKMIATMLWVALATYFHFLVGGAWAAFLLLFALAQGRGISRVVLLGVLYAALILPIFLVLVYEREFGNVPDISDLDLTLNQVYGSFRGPHHVSPFNSVRQFKVWLPGISALIGGVLIAVCIKAERSPIERPLVQWLLLLHLYLVLMFLAAFLDRNSHFLAPFYIFRPNALILFLGLMVTVRWLRLSLSVGAGRSLAVIALVVAGVFSGSKLIDIGSRLTAERPLLSVDSFVSDDQHRLVAWIRRNTESDSVVVLEPTPKIDWSSSWNAFEQVIRRPTLVNFKFVPTLKSDLARWYRLIRWREAVFDGNCARIAEQPVDYLVTVTREARTVLARCGTLLRQFGAYGVVDVTNSAVK